MKGRLLVGVALGALFLYLAMRNVDLRETWDTLRHAHYGYYAAMIALNIVALWLRAVRWSILLRPVRTVSAGRLLSPLCIGLMSNLIFPARAGEFVRAYLVGKKENISKSSAFATVVVERLFDGLAIITFLGAAPFFFHQVEGTMARKLQWAGAGLVTFYISVLAVLLVLSHHREALSRFLEGSSAARRWVVVARFFELVRKFTDGLAILKSAGEVLGAITLSLIIWGIAGVINLLMMHSIDIYLPLYASFFLLVCQSFGVMVPSPGFVGGYQAAHVFALSLYNVSDSRAFSLSILLHSGFFVTYVGLGLFFLGREHLGWRELGKATAEES